MVEGMGYGRKKILDMVIRENFETEPNTIKYSYDDIIFILDELLTLEGKSYVERGITKRGHEIFRHFVKYLLHRNIANFDAFLLISSLKGSGKSSAAIMIGREWCKNLGIKFDVKKHICYNNSDVMNKMMTLPPFSPIIVDEGGRIASASDWAKKENKELKKKLAEVRTKHFLFILCYPMSVKRIDSTYMNSFVNYWLHLTHRGEAAIFTPELSPGREVWNLKQFEHLAGFTEFTEPHKIAEILKGHKNFWTTMKIGKVPRHVYERYLMVREKNVYNDDNVLASVSNTDIIMSLLILTLRDLIANDSTLSMNRIVLHIKNKYDINITKQQIQDVVEDAKQLSIKLQEKAVGLRDDYKDTTVIKEEKVEDGDM